MRTTIEIINEQGKALQYICRVCDRVANGFAHPGDEQRCAHLQGYMEGLQFALDEHGRVKTLEEVCNLSNLPSALTPLDCVRYRGYLQGLCFSIGIHESLSSCELGAKEEKQ